METGGEQIAPQRTFADGGLQIAGSWLQQDEHLHVLSACSADIAQTRVPAGGGKRAICVSAGSSPTSSRKSVPPLASSKRPMRCCIAPVKAPFRGLKQFDAINFVGESLSYSSR